jgi:hypothetical protein
MRLHIRMKMDTPAFGHTHGEMRRVLLEAVERIPVARRAMAGYYLLLDNDKKEIGDAIVHAADGREPLAFIVQAQVLEKIARAAKEIDAAMLNPSAINRNAIANMARAIISDINDAKRKG